MIQIALKLGTLTETDTVALATTINNSLPTVPAVTPDPTLAALQSIRLHAEGARGLSGHTAGPKIVP